MRGRVAAWTVFAALAGAANAQAIPPKAFNPLVEAKDYSLRLVGCARRFGS